jgi:hypothetical protein
MDYGVELIVFFFNVPNPYSRTMALGSTQLVTEMSTRNLPGSKKLNFFKILICEAIGTAATPGLLCQPRVIVEKQMECRLAGETKVLGENLPQRHFCPSQNPT